MHLFDWSFYGQLCNMTSCCEKWRGRWLYRPVGFLDIIRLVLSGHTYSVCVHDLSLTALVTLLFSFWFFCFVLLMLSVAGSMTWWYIYLSVFSLCPLCRFWEHLSPHRRWKDLLHCLRVARDTSVRLPFGWCRRSARHHIWQGHCKSGENVCGESGGTYANT